MKVIDLLNKIANGEEIPKKIIFKNELYTLKKWENIEETDYLCESTGNLLGDIYLTSLNEEVEIIEDTIEDNKEINNLQKRIDKAIEYIEPKMINEYIHTDYVNNMIKILKGEK